MCKIEHPKPLGYIPPVYHQEQPSPSPPSSTTSESNLSTQMTDQELTWWQVIKAGFFGGLIGGTIGGLMVVSSMFILRKLGTTRK